MKTAADQQVLIASLERHVGVADPAQAKMTPVLLKALYDEDFLDEEVIMSWHAGPSPAAYSFADVTAEVAKTVKSKAAVFITWLAEAEEDDDEDESEED